MCGYFLIVEAFCAGGIARNTQEVQKSTGLIRLVREDPLLGCLLVSREIQLNSIHE